MADRISALQAEIESLHATTKASSTSEPTAKKKSKKEPPPPEPAVDEDSVIARLRLELAEALRSKGVSETRLRTAQEEVDRLQTRAKSNEKSIRTLESDNSTLTRKLNDRDHELREKRKLLEVRIPWEVC
jgi:chromosome segregation ATPase